MKHIKIDEKYTIMMSEKGEPYVFKALRYGEPWRDLAGDNLILAFVSKFIEKEKKEEMEIHDWCIWNCWTENSTKKFCVTGKVVNNPKFENKAIITTSLVEIFDAKRMKIKTRNSIYFLKRPEISFLKELELQGNSIEDFHSGDIP